jgi:RimJ/RimL family protein N-acetyltransferase
MCAGLTVGPTDYLAPSHHGQGIMSAVVKALVERWAVPRLGARWIRPTTFEDNAGSMRVFLKNGFVLWKTVPDGMTTPAKGEFPAQTIAVNVLEYRPGEPEALAVGAQQVQASAMGEGSAQ